MAQFGTPYVLEQRRRGVQNSHSLYRSFRHPDGMMLEKCVYYSTFNEADEDFFGVFYVLRSYVGFAGSPSYFLGGCL